METTVERSSSFPVQKGAMPPPMISDDQARLFELEKLHTFVRLHTGKEDVTMQMVSLGEKIKNAFKWRGAPFGRLLITPEAGVDGLIRVALATRKNYIPLFHLVFKDSWHTYQQVTKYEGPEVYQVVSGKSDYWTAMILMCKTATTWEELAHGIKRNFNSQVMKDLNKVTYKDYSTRPATDKTQALYTLNELLEDIERFKAFE